MMQEKSRKNEATHELEMTANEAPSDVRFPTRKSGSSFENSIYDYFVLVLIFFVRTVMQLYQ